MSSKYFNENDIRKHRNQNKFYVISRDFYEGDSGTVCKLGLGYDLNNFINMLIELKNDGFKNIHFESDDPYCGVDISVSKLENEKSP